MHRRWQRGSIVLGLLGGLLCGLLGAAPVLAQSEPGPETDPLNHAYSVYLGSGFYVSGGRSVLVLRVAPSFRVRSEEEHAFGVRIRLNTTLGFYDLNLGDFPNFEFPERVGTVAFVPGVEFPIRIFPNWTLGPFLDFGPAIDSETRDLTWVLGVGLRSRAEWDTPRLQYLLWNDLVLANNISNDQSVSDQYNLLRTRLEIRRLVNYTLFKRGFDLGLTTGADLHFDPLVIPAFNVQEEREIRERYEIGLTTGSTDRWKLFNLFTAPRLGLAYRFGQGVSTVSVLFRLRY